MRETVGGFTFKMEPVSGGMFTQVSVHMVDGPRVYCKSHFNTTDAELDYAAQKAKHGLEATPAADEEDTSREALAEGLMKAKVILFKPSGKYYTEEEWEVPAEVPDYSRSRGKFTREAIVPADMLHSPDFRRIEGGPVLVESQEPWGYPHLFPGVPS